MHGHVFVMVILTFCAETGTGGEFGNIDNLYGKLFPRVFVEASSHEAERSPENIQTIHFVANVMS